MKLLLLAHISNVSDIGLFVLGLFGSDVLLAGLGGLDWVADYILAGLLVGDLLNWPVISDAS